MAKKTARKMSKKTAKASRRPAPKKAGKKPRAPSGTPSGMFKVSTGPGRSPAEIGGGLVSMFNNGQFAEIEEEFWSPAIVSCEGCGVGLEWRGRKAVEAKNNDWMSKNEILGARATGPFVGSTGFAVHFDMEVRDKASGATRTMKEVGVYTVRNGKIVREEFMYGS